MRDGFLLDPEVAYFNHGGYGACPVEVFAEYQRLYCCAPRSAPYNDSADLERLVGAVRDTLAR